jgi:DNA sulfur modification protein DndD
LIIQNIEIVNFGPFVGSQKIIFNNGGLGVHLIRGMNGSGKTSIQRAILWCLYGSVKDRNGNEIKSTSLLNYTAKKRDIYDFYVNLGFRHEGGAWILHRRMQGKSHSDREYSSHMNLSLTKDGEIIANPAQVIQRIIPSDISRFFFFDGEMLSDYEELLYTEADTMLLRNSIESVLGIPYLKTSREDVRMVQRMIESQRNKILRRLGGDEYDEIVKQSEVVQENINQCENNIKVMEAQSTQLEAESLSKKRDLTKIESIKKLSLDRIRFESEIKTLQSEKEGEFTKRSQYISQLYKNVLSGTAQSLVSKLETMHDRVMKKYDKKQKLLGEKELISKGMAEQKCRTCGTILNEAKLNDLRNQLKEIDIKIDALTEIPEPNLEFEQYAEVLRKVVSFNEQNESIGMIQKRIDEIDYEIAVKNSQLNKIKEALVGQDEEEPKRIEMEIRNIEREMGRIEGLMTTERESLKEFVKMKGELDEKISSIDQSELNVLVKRIETTQAIIQILEEAIGEYSKQKKQEVETEATRIFRQIKSKDIFDHLQINDQYGLAIVTKSGAVLDRGEIRSSGEEQTVALSLIGALNKCANIDVAVFMDTPMGRLDEVISENVLRFIPNLADQVTLLVTGKELRRGDEKFLEGKIMSDFTVKHISEEDGSKIYFTQEGDTV